MNEKHGFLKPILHEGEVYAGLILGKDGGADYHLIILPGEAKNVSWQYAIEWSKSYGGDLPTLLELRLEYVNACEHFKKGTYDYYWSNEQLPSHRNFAMCFSFKVGHQSDNFKDGKCNVRAVRRVPIER